MELRTKRLILQRPTRADVDAIFKIHNDPQACAHNPSDALTTQAEAENLFRRWMEQWERHGTGYWVIRWIDSAACLGFCGLKFMQFRGIRVLNLFCRLHPRFWGDGIGSEATTAVVAWSKTTWPSHPIIARVRPQNLGSQRVALRCGLTRAEQLDINGEDGPDLIFTTGWPEMQGFGPPRPPSR
jgi:[ribosomal protein S5]-alanine N-acetyltransferase